MYHPWAVIELFLSQRPELGGAEIIEEGFDDITQDGRKQLCPSPLSHNIVVLAGEQTPK